MRKKKQLAAFMLLTAMLLNLTACVKTPEENIVTDNRKDYQRKILFQKRRMVKKNS